MDDRYLFRLARTPEERREALILQLVGVFVGLVLGALVFVMIRTGWSPVAAFRG